MASQEDQTRNEYLKELAEREKAVAEGIAEVVRDQKGSAKDRNALVKQGKAIEKSHRTLGGDLTKNVQDMKDGIQTTVDGMINETFGPLGGIVSTFTTGFFKRGKENKENLSATEATLEAAEANLEELKNGRIETKGSMTTLEGEQKKTTKAIKGGRETAEEREKKQDKHDKSLIDALKDLKVKSVKDIADDGGFFAGLGTIASVLGGIALGLSAPGFFKIGTLTTALENFTTKFPKIAGKVKTFFGFADDIPKFPDTPKVPDIPTKMGGWKSGLKQFFGFADEVPKFPDAPKIPDVPTKLTGWKTAFSGFFSLPAKQVDTATDALKVAAEGADAAGDAGKVTSKLKTFLGPTMTGVFDSVAGKVDDIAKGAKVAAAEGGMLSGLGKMFGKTALKLTAGVAGRALSVAGNPVFDLIATGKDVFDIAHAVTDDDVATAVKKEDVGAVIGSIVGGALGFALGGPAGAALGIGLGNMAGEFIGSAMDDPEILGAINTVREGLKSEQATLKTEIADIEKQIKDTTGAVSEEMKALLRERKLQIEGRQTDITAELANMEALKVDEAELKAIQKKGFDLAAKKDKLKDEIEAAEDAGDHARVAMLEKMLVQTEEDFEKAEEDYATKAEDLRKKAQKTSSELADKSTSFFDKLATGGGAMGWFGELFGGEGLEGEAKTKLVAGEAKEEKEKLVARLDKMKGMKDFRGKKGMMERLEKQIGEKDELIKSTESGEFQQKQIDELNKLIAEEQDKITKSEGGEDMYWGREHVGIEESRLKIAEANQKIETLNAEIAGLKGAARGAFVVNRPTYLPSSGIIVGESKASSPKGRGLAGGGFTDGPPELVQMGGGATQVYPLGGSQADNFIKPVAQSIAGAAMNAAAADKIGLGGPVGMGASPNIVDASTNTNVTNNTIIRTPSPSGPNLHFERRDFVHKIA